MGTTPTSRRLELLRDYVDQAQTGVLSAQPADHVHFDPARQAWRQGRNDYRVIAPPSRVLVIDRQYRIRVANPNADDLESISLKCRGCRSRTGLSGLLRLALLPSQQVAYRRCRNEQRERRV